KQETRRRSRVGMSLCYLDSADRADHYEGRRIAWYTIAVSSEPLTSFIEVAVGLEPRSIRDRIFTEGAREGSFRLLAEPFTRLPPPRGSGAAGGYARWPADKIRWTVIALTPVSDAIARMLSPRSRSVWTCSGRTAALGRPSRWP